ncbi:MAG: LysR family transcriptional regulator [Burkholderiaceae bacterium]|nr:LysR family transcriptional regulator [Burkholderiaceae bacterium]
MNLTLLQLRIFSAIAGHGSVRSAARALGIAQSGVTQQLHNLEQIAGAPLFNRTNRGVILTSVGERLLLRASSILGECTRAEHEIRQLQGDMSGTISFGIATEPLIRTLPLVLSDFHSRFPLVETHLMSGTSRKMISWVRKGSLDFAIALVTDQTDTTDLSVSPLYPSKPAVICRKGHPLQDKKSISDLVDCFWISTRQPDLSESPANRLIDLFSRNALPMPKIVATTEALFDTLHLVAQGDYLSLEPFIVTEHSFFKNALTHIPIRESIQVANICLIHRSAVPLTPAAQKIFAMLASHARTFSRKNRN